MFKPKSDYKIIAHSKDFDKKWYLKNYPDVKENNTDPVWHYMTFGWRENRNPSPRFSTSAYLTYNPDVRLADMCPLLHWERFGKHEKRIKGCAPMLIQNNKPQQCPKGTICPEQIADYNELKHSNLFNAKWYKKNYNIPDNYDPTEHYLNQGFKCGYNPSELFHNDFYLSTYPDILFADINPLIHYIRFGKSEGRQITPSTPSADYTIQPKKTILLISHELSLTGAPIALMNFAKILKKNKIPFMILSPKQGDLESELQKHDLPYLVEPGLFAKLYRQDPAIQSFFNKFDTILFNTIDTLRYAQYVDAHATKICWVHEGAFGYSCAELSFDIYSAFDAMDMVYSVGAYSKSFTDKYITSEKSKTFLYGIDDIGTTTPSESENTKLTFGVFGTCCQRKAQDIFIEAIKKLPQHIKSRCRFKIVGHIPNDSYCKHLKELARGEQIIFTGQLSHAETLAEMINTDVIVCPSLDDPMPIVCTEAMMLNKPVICSDQTGTASFIQDGVNSFIFHTNENNLNEIIVRAFNNKGKLQTMGTKWHDVYTKNFTNQVFEQNVLNIALHKKWCCNNATTVLVNSDTLHLPNNTFNIIVPIGASCHTSMMLRMLNLQTYSYPLDWSASDEDGNKDMGLSQRIKLICNNFKNFINQSDLIDKHIAKKKHRYIVNRRTYLHYVHDFPTECEISDEYPNFYARYSRRVKRLLDDISSAADIAFVWSQDTWDQIRKKPTYQSNDTWINSYNALVERFPGKNITLLVFEHDSNVPQGQIEETIIDNKIFRFKSNHSQIDTECCPSKYNQHMVANIGAVLCKLTKNQ